MKNDTLEANVQTANIEGPGAEEMVDALNNTFGKHPGRRASHAKGFCTAGTFVPAADAKEFASSEIFSIPVSSAIIRFSVGGGNPAVSDKSRTVRGMGMRVSSASERWDLVMVSEPVFFAATPASFVSFLQARVADPITKKPDPAKVAAHNELFPDGKLQASLLASHAAPCSYAQTPYFTNNAFLFRGATGSTEVARIIVEPSLGTKYLSAEDESSLDDNFLEKELSARLRNGSVDFQIWAQLPDADDSHVDPSQRWIGTRKILLGTLHISQRAAVEVCDGLVFSPNNLPQAIFPSEDPILASRHAAYSVSLSRRRATPSTT